MLIQSNMYQLHDLYLLQKGATQTTSTRQSSLVLILKIANFEARVTKLATNVTGLNIRYFDKRLNKNLILLVLGRVKVQ